MSDPAKNNEALINEWFVAKRVVDCVWYVCELYSFSFSKEN
jgi:hypothetical protein